MTSSVASCINCRWWDGNRGKPIGWYCMAFGDMPIPPEIAKGLHDHKSPYPGDSGIRFEKITNAHRNPNRS